MRKTTTTIPRKSANKSAVTPTSTGSAQWISASEAARRMETTIHHIRNCAIGGIIAAKVEMGSPPKYSASDVDRIAAERRAESA